MAHGVGYNVKLEPDEIAAALKEAAIQKLAQRGRQLSPLELTKFHAEAGVFIRLAPNNSADDKPQEVSALQDVSVTWTE